MNLRVGKQVEVHNPADFPEPHAIETMLEPWIRATIMVPEEYLGSVLTLCTDKRGEQVDMKYIAGRIMVIYRLPLNEIFLIFTIV